MARFVKFLDIQVFLTVRLLFFREQELVSTPAPVAKPRALSFHTSHSESSMTTPTPSTYDGGGGGGGGRSNSVGTATDGSMTPPIPRPRQRSGEQKKELESMRQRINSLEKELEEAKIKLKDGERDRSQLRETARRESVELKQSVRKSEVSFERAQHDLNEREAHIAELEEQLNSIKNPRDPKKRIEVRLSEALGKVARVEKEKSQLRSVSL